jgi:hypothetical protein
MSLQPRHGFFGAESLAGYVVSSAHWAVIPNMAEETSLVATPIADEKSVACYPVRREQTIAGCIVVKSSQIDAFTPAVCPLIEQYADLMLLAFYEADFYPYSSVELAIMPPFSVQRPWVATWRERKEALLLRAAREDQALTAKAAERLVWAQLEEACLQWKPSPVGEQAANAESSPHPALRG